ncbi:MAG TPA: hypothetical protein VHV56_09865 [Pseudolabrys sp.]|nr:hypothetical protein [Pseudolabrys sp.]
MSESAGVAEDNTVAYSYRPSLLGAPWEFHLVGDSLTWVAGAKSGRVALRDIRRVRMGYKPVSMQSYRFMTELWASGAPKLRVVSTTWQSMVEQVAQSGPYSAFVAELHRRIAMAAPPARFEQGANPFSYWPGLAVFAAVSLALAWMTVRGLQAGSTAGAALVGVFLALFLWQGGNFFRRNRPGLYRPDALPAELMPRG